MFIIPGISSTTRDSFFSANNGGLAALQADGDSQVNRRSADAAEETTIKSIFNKRPEHEHETKSPYLSTLKVRFTFEGKKLLSLEFDITDTIHIGAGAVTWVTNELTPSHFFWFTCKWSKMMNMYSTLISKHVSYYTFSRECWHSISLHLP